MSQSKKNEQNQPLWAKTGHGKPMSRREMLAAGMIPFAAQLIMPQWLSLMMGSKAHAAGEACAPADASWIPFITLNLSGGAALMANFVPHDAAGQPLPSYSLMGMGTSPTLTYEFGRTPWAGNGVSKVLTGIRAEAANGTIDRTAFAAVCVALKDDSGDNKLGVEGMITRAGRMGLTFPNLGTAASATGMNHQPALIVPPAPLRVNGYRSIGNSLGYAADLGSVLNVGQQRSLASLVQKLSGEQVQRLGQSTRAQDIQKVVDCAGIGNVSNLSRPPGAGVDPRLDAQVSAVWDITAGTADGDRNLTFAAMVYNVLNGNAGAATLELGGYDYHDNSRTTGDRKDQEAGVLIGRILETAARMNRPVFLYVTSDGSVSSPDSASATAPWSSDRGSAGVSYMFFYDPAGRRALVNDSFQVGQFTRGQAADERFITGGSAEMSAVAVFANYLAVNRKLGMFGSVTKDKLSRTDLERVVKFAG